MLKTLTIASDGMCDECGAPIDQATGFCIACGLEIPDFKDQRFDKMVLQGAKFTGEEESRQRKARKVRSYGSGRGYTCILCLEMFRSAVRPEADEEMLEIEAKQRGAECAGTDLAHFLLKQELEDHIKLIHGGRREYWKKVNDKKRMLKVRELERLNKDTSVNTFRGKGENQGA